MRAESAFDCAKYNEAEQSLWTNSFKVALPKGMEKKARHGALPRPLIPGKLKTCKLDVNILNFSYSSHTLQYLLPVLTVQVYIVQFNYCIVVCCLYVHKSYFI